MGYESKLKIRFLLSKVKVNSNGQCPILFRITCNGVRAGSGNSSGVYVHPSKWDASAQKIKGNSKDVQIDNQVLETIRTQLKSIWLDFEAKGQRCTALQIKEIYLNQGKPSHTLIGVYEEFIRYLEGYKGTERELSPVTLQHWGTRKRNLIEFLKLKYKQSDIELESVKYSMSDELQRYFTVEKKFGNDHTVKQIGCCITVLKFAVKQNYISFNPFESVVLKRSPSKDPEFLDEAELKYLEEYKFAQDRLSNIRDLFVFQCYTGLGFGELENLVKGVDSVVKLGLYDGRMWVYVERPKEKKYNSVCKVPLLKKPLELIANYGGIDKLPIISNPKYNSYLKEVFEVVGISKLKIVTHLGRKTFGNLALNNWKIPIETVSAMLGHKDIQTTQRYYARVQDSRISDDMKYIE